MDPHGTAYMRNNLRFYGLGRDVCSVIRASSVPCIAQILYKVFCSVQRLRSLPVQRPVSRTLSSILFHLPSNIQHAVPVLAERQKIMLRDANKGEVTVFTGHGR